MLLINCKIDIILTWCKDWILISARINAEVPKFAKSDTKRYVSVVTLSIQENVKF